MVHSGTCKDCLIEIHDQIDHAQRLLLEGAEQNTCIYSGTRELFLQRIRDSLSKEYSFGLPAGFISLPVWIGWLFIALLPLIFLNVITIFVGQWIWALFFLAFFALCICLYKKYYAWHCCYCARERGWKYFHKSACLQCTNQETRLKLQELHGKDVMQTRATRSAMSHQE